MISFHNWLFLPLHMVTLLSFKMYFAGFLPIRVRFELVTWVDDQLSIGLLGLQTKSFIPIVRTCVQYIVLVHIMQDLVALIFFKDARWWCCSSFICVCRFNNWLSSKMNWQYNFVLLLKSVMHFPYSWTMPAVRKKQYDYSWTALELYVDIKLSTLHWKVDLVVTGDVFCLRPV